MERVVMNSKLIVALALVLAVATLAGCPSSRSGSVYSRDEAQREQVVRMGVVEGVRSVTIEGTKSPVGTVAGGAVGGIAGSSVGHGTGSAVAAVVGAVAGGLAGAAAEEALTRKEGVEVTVRLDNGELRAIVQEADEVFKPGERVRLVSQGGITRVTH
jgi:outer membrane lipoprotein SlyB